MHSINKKSTRMSQRLFSSLGMETTVRLRVIHIANLYKSYINIRPPPIMDYQLMTIIYFRPRMQRLKTMKRSLMTLKSPFKIFPMKFCHSVNNYTTQSSANITLLKMQLICTLQEPMPGKLSVLKPLIRRSFQRIGMSL